MTEDSKKDFHQTLWSNWLDGSLDWKNFQPWEFDHVNKREEWECNQSWILQDENNFYYPLFGLGVTDKEPLIAVVGMGPAYNVGGDNKWTIHTCENHREVINGPFAMQNSWEGGVEPYKDCFCEQKKEWEDNRNEDNNLHNKLVTLHEEFENYDIMDSGKPFSNMYFTNFMKDGDFDSSYLTYCSLPDELTIDTDGDDGLYRFEHVDCDLISDECDWPRLVKTRKQSEDGFFKEVCQFASREFWLPILGKELDTVDPDVILALGHPSNKAVCELYTDSGEYNDECLPKKIRSEEVGPSVIIARHWSYNNWNIEKTAEKVNDALKNDG